MNCFFCDNTLCYGNRVSPECQRCNTSEIIVKTFNGTAQMYYKGYQIVLKFAEKLTTVYQNNPWTAKPVVVLNGFPLNPSNIVDKLSTFILLS